MGKRLHDAQGRWVALDARHHIAKEGTGSLKNQWAFRFCDDFIAAYPTKQEATKAALQWEMARVSRMCA